MYITLQKTEDADVGQLKQSADTATGFVRKITKFTIFATLVQWLVCHPHREDIHIQKARAFIRAVKPKKNLNERDKLCLKICECKYLHSWLYKDFTILIHKYLATDRS